MFFREKEHWVYLSRVVGMRGSEVFEMNESVDLSSLRMVLRDAGFTEENVSGLINRCGTNRGWNLPSMLRLTEGSRRLNRLVRLFVLGQPVSETAIRDVLAPFPHFILFPPLFSIPPIIFLSSIPQ